MIDTITHLLQCTLFDAFRTSKIREFCASPSVETFKRLVIDEVAKNYGLFNTRQVGEFFEICSIYSLFECLDASARSRNHLERLKNETVPPSNKWMMSKVRIQHEIARLDQVG